MDDYTQMKLYNPYLQMAMGIMAGNSGRSKSEAFANAMGGGLSAAQNAQKMAMEQGTQDIAKQRAAREQQAWEQQQAEQQAVQQWAAGMMQKDPANASYYELMVQNPAFGVQWFKTAKEAENDAARTAAYRALGGARGGGSGAKPNPWSYKDMSDSDYANIDAEMSVQHGDAWDKLDPQQKRATAMQIYAQRMYDADRGLPPGPSGVTLPDPRLGPIDRLMKKGGDLWDTFLGTAAEGGAQQRGADDFVTDSQGRKWKYKGSGDRNDQKNYREVK